MGDVDLTKTARQMVDDLINDDAESAKSNFHDFLVKKAMLRLNPEAATQEDKTPDFSDDDDPSVGAEDFSDDDESTSDDSESEDDEEVK